MEQLSTFDTERKTGFRHRWHLYRGDQLMYTCIPSQRGVTLIGLPLPMKNTKEILELSCSEGASGEGWKVKNIYRLPVSVEFADGYIFKKKPNEVMIGTSSPGFAFRTPTYHFTDAEIARYPEDVQKIFQACIKEEVQ